MVPTLLDFRGASDTPLEMCENGAACGAQALPGPPKHSKRETQPVEEAEEETEELCCTCSADAH